MFLALTSGDMLSAILATYRIGWLVLPSNGPMFPEFIKVSMTG